MGSNGKYLLLLLSREENGMRLSPSLEVWMGAQSSYYTVQKHLTGSLRRKSLLLD